MSETDMEKVNTILVGEAGNLRVRSELLLRGIPTAVADVDDGVDVFLTRSRKAIQVKTCVNPTCFNKDNSWKYSFSIRCTQFRRGNKGVYRQVRRRKYKVDFFILWCVRDNLFYILPGNILNERISIGVPVPEEHLGRKKRTWKESSSKYEKFKNAWHLLKDL